MNIFVLDSDPEIAAQNLCDKHVVKMALETAQILSTINDGPYKPTHQKHPCVLWAREMRANYDWLVRHGIGICNEYTYRYQKQHKSEEVIYALQEPLVDIEEGVSPFVLCMPDDCKIGDAVSSYREYYRKYKAPIAKWTTRNAPSWF
jgi:hypothetical protein